MLKLVRNFIVCCGIVFMGSCASTPNKNADVEVIGNGSIVQFSWATDHPWAKQFQAQGMRMHLFAQYKSASLPVEQDLGVGIYAPPTQVRFQLSDTLLAVPDGPVCLFLSTSRAASAIPIRMPSDHQADTARFRNPAWEHHAVVSTRTSLTAKQERELSESLTALDQQIDLAHKLATKDGIATAADCVNVKATSSNLSDSMQGVLEPAEQEDGAERVCVRRARNMRNSLMINSKYLVDLEKMVNNLTIPRGAANSAVINVQIQTFQANWNKWISKTGVDYVPEVGTDSNFLPMGGILLSQLEQMNKSSVRDSDLEKTITMGLLDSYSGCLEDVKKQLNQKYVSWVHEQTNKPAREAAHSEYIRKQCVAQFDKVDALVKEKQELQHRAQQSHSVTSYYDGNEDALQSGLQQLNQVDCSL